MRNSLSLCITLLMAGITVYDASAQTGNFGIGTPTPEFKLSIDNDGGILAKGEVGSGLNLSTAGAGTRLVWYPKKAAFRVGTVDGDQWDDANIGEASFASGFDAQASGYAAIAMGNFSFATANNTTAIGFNTTASAVGAMAIGSSSWAGGVLSMAMGSGATANGGQSIAMGYNVFTTAGASYSCAIGTFVEADHSGSVLIGDHSTNYMFSSAGNQYSARFAGGYRFYSDATMTDANGLFLKAGNVGIGVEDPTVKLDLDGQLRIRGGSPGEGKVLTSDADGKATWAAPAPGIIMLSSGANSSSLHVPDPYALGQGNFKLDYFNSNPLVGSPGNAFIVPRNGTITSFYGTFTPSAPVSTDWLLSLQIYIAPSGSDTYTATGAAGSITIPMLSTPTQSVNVSNLSIAVLAGDRFKLVYTPVLGSGDFVNGFASAAVQIQ